MQLSTPAIICAVLPHGEAGAVVRALTPGHGLMAGYVRGGRSRRLRPVLIVGNTVDADFRARLDEQLAALTVELIRSRAHLATDALAATALAWLGALVATALPEAQPFPAVHPRLEALLESIAVASPVVWAADLVRFELHLLADLGFGLDLARCAATGQTHDLAWVSPKSRSAVNRASGAPYAARLLPLPAFLIAGTSPDWEQIAQALRLTGHFLTHDVLEGRDARILPARARLEELVERRAHH